MINEQGRLVSVRGCIMTVRGIDAPVSEVIVKQSVL